MDTRKQNILAALSSFVDQRPGFELANYSTWSQYQSDYRPVLKAKHDFYQMWTLKFPGNWPIT